MTPRVSAVYKARTSTGSRLEVAAPNLEPDVHRLVAGILAGSDERTRLALAAPALLDALKRARPCLAWASEQRPDFAAEYAAADAAIAAATSPQEIQP